MNCELRIANYETSGPAGFRRLVLPALGVILFCPLVSAQPADETLPPVDEALFAPPRDRETAERIDGLIRDLRSPDYHTRTTAVENLIALGPRAFTQLRDAYQQAHDLETTLQIERIVQSAYMNREVYSKHGFLGVSLWPYPTANASYNVVTLPEGQVGVQLTRIIPDTGASRAGLQPKDVITAVDGVPLEGAGQQLVNTFSRGISQRRPGDTMRLTIVRPEGQQDIEVTLGTCPPELAESGSVRAVHERLQEVTQEMESWWERYFRRPARSSADASSP